MMKSALPALGGLLLLLASVRADYVIVQKVEGGMQSGTMTIKIKDSKVRTDVAPQLSTISDGETGDVITLMHDQKTYMTIPAAQAKTLMEKMQKTAALKQSGATAPPKLTPTLRTEKVGEYECEIYTWNGYGMNLTFWFAKDYPDYPTILKALEQVQNTGMAALAKGMMPNVAEYPGMVVKTEMTVGNQKVTTTLVSAKEEPVVPSAFKVPPEYKETPTPDFNAFTPPTPK